jgi:class 3 adenylate cyclase
LRFRAVQLTSHSTHDHPSRRAGRGNPSARKHIADTGRTPVLPTGTVTFLLTDIEGSTRLWDHQPQAARNILARHDAILETLATEHAGVVVRPRGEGDSRFVVFQRASDAVAAACAIQQAMLAEPWPMHSPLRVRMALHTGEADLRDGDYYGGAINSWTLDKKL